MLDLVEHMEVGAIVQGLIDLDAGVSPTQEREDVKKAIEFGLRISLDDGFEFSEERFDDVTADQKRELSDSESALDLKMALEPGYQADANL